MNYVKMLHDKHAEELASEKTAINEMGAKELNFVKKNFEDQINELKHVLDIKVATINENAVFSILINLSCW